MNYPTDYLGSEMRALNGQWFDISKNKWKLKYKRERKILGARDSNEWVAKAQDVSWFFLQIHPMIFVGVQEYKVLLYIGEM